MAAKESESFWDRQKTVDNWRKLLAASMAATIDVFIRSKIGLSSFPTVPGLAGATSWESTVQLHTLGDEWDVLEQNGKGGLRTATWRSSG